VIVNVHRWRSMSATLAGRHRQEQLLHNLAFWVWMRRYV